MTRLIAAMMVIAVFVGCEKPTRTVEMHTAGTPDASLEARNEAALLSSDDRDFVREAAAGGRMEVQLGEIAERQAGSDAVRDFGARMVKDHSAANRELMGIARAKGAEIPGELGSRQRRMVERLSRLRGAEFDREYVRAMVSDHEEDVAKFRRQARDSKDPDLKAFAEKTLPTLEEHLNHARELNKTMRDRRPATAPR